MNHIQILEAAIDSAKKLFITRNSTINDGKTTNGQRLVMARKITCYGQIAKNAATILELEGADHDTLRTEYIYPIVEDPQYTGFITLFGGF